MSECTHGNMTAHGNPCPWCKNIELEAELAELREAAPDLERVKAAIAIYTGAIEIDWGVAWDRAALLK